MSTATPAPASHQTFGQLVRARREELNLSRAAMALRVGVSKPAIQQYEGDDTLPRAAKFPRLAAALEVTLPELAEWVRYSPHADATLPPRATGASPGLRLHPHLTPLPRLVSLQRAA